MRYNVIIPKPVHDRIDEIYYYIAITKGNPDDALKLVDRIYDTISSLDIFPERGSEFNVGRHAG